MRATGATITPGIDYEFSPTPPPACGADVPEPAFTPEGAHRLNPDEVATLAALFADPTLTGGQIPPRLGKWVNADNFIFVQLDDLAAPTAVRYFGVGSVGSLLRGNAAVDRLHPLPPLPRRRVSGRACRRTGRGGRLLAPLDRRRYVRGARWPADHAGGRPRVLTHPATGLREVAIPSPAASSASVAVIAREWFFEPTSLHVRAGQPVALSVTNAGEQLHTFTVPNLGIDTGPLQPGATENLIFTAPAERGTYEVLCTFPGHEEAGMIGSLVVA